MDRLGRIIRHIWAGCLILAGLNHARILFQHGPFWDYGGVSWFSAAYWSSLTIMDPMTALLLLIRPAVGVPVTAVLIATNVVHNLAITALCMPADTLVGYVLSSLPIMSQIGFLIFVVATWRLALHGIRFDGRRLTKQLS